VDPDLDSDPDTDPDTDPNPDPYPYRDTGKTCFGGGMHCSIASSVACYYQRITLCCEILGD